MKYKQLGIVGIVLSLVLITQFARSASKVTVDRPNPSQGRSINFISQSTSLSYSLETYQSAVI